MAAATETDSLVPERYQCSICFSVFRDPVQTPCGHHFCRVCILNWLGQNTGSVCPIDRRPLRREQLFSDEALRREIAGIPDEQMLAARRNQERNEDQNQQSTCLQILRECKALCSECLVGVTACDLGSWDFGECDDHGLCDCFESCGGSVFCKRFLAGIVLLACLPVLCFAKIAVGSMYYYECPAEPQIPVYLVVEGCFGVYSILMTVVRLAVSEERLKRILTAVVLGLYVFSAIWFIIGCAWVYSVLTRHDISTIAAGTNYCNETLYLFSFCANTISLVLGVGIYLFVTGLRYAGWLHCDAACFRMDRRTME